MERLEYGVIMSSYKDYLNGNIPITDENISRAVSSMSAAANKRLKRMEEQGWTYVKADSERSETDSIAGHKKFGARGKNKQELYSEYKRLKDFFESGMSSVTEVRRQAKEFNIEAAQLKDYMQMKEAQTQYEKDSEQFVEYERPMTRKELKDLEQALKAEATRAERLGEEFSKDENMNREWYQEWLDGLHLYNYLIETGRYKPSRRDSDQVRELCNIVVASHKDWDKETMANWVLETDARSRDARRRYRGRSTSDFVYGNNI